MTIDEHLQKWRRFDAARAGLDADRDFELGFWAMLSAGTTIINAALHAAGVTRENDLFATQIPDVYAVHDGGKAWHHELGSLCDLIHVGLPELDCELPPEIARAFAAMHVIERYRDPCIRSGAPATADVKAACSAAYADLLAAIQPILQGAAQ
ncbi:MAG TPA: hypothetical protein VLJ86_23975 [Ramlibacter sp.]|nr:hypothetical protein [Ramlibacter sp.]